LANSGQKLEKKVKSILDESIGSEIKWIERKFILLDWAKPMGQKTGEVKTDFLLILEEKDSKQIKLIKISGKQRNMGAVHNKLTRLWCESIYGENWENHILKQILSISNKDGFHKDKIIDFKNKTITLGFRHEILYEPDSGRERGIKTIPEITPAVFWGDNCPIEYRDGKIKNLKQVIQQKLKNANLTYENNDEIIKNSGIPDYVIKADDDELKNLNDIIDKLDNIQEFSEHYKDELIDAFFAHNYRIDWKATCKHCQTKYRTIWGNVIKDNNIVSTNSQKCPSCKKSGRENSSSTPIQGLTRSMVLPIKWTIVEGKLDGVLSLKSFHKINSGDVLLSLRNCLIKLGIDDDDDFDLEDLRGKITERTSMNLTKENFKKFYSDF
jgi:hypothetical protein